jgi:hypothetical protein
MIYDKNPAIPLEYHPHVKWEHVAYLSLKFLAVAINADPQIYAMSVPQCVNNGTPEELCMLQRPSPKCLLGVLLME